MAKNGQRDTRFFGPGVVSRKYRLPTLVRHIQTILRDYDDRQILKELVQNAEDAGATQVKLLYDEHHYSSVSLLHEDLDQFQGPALYAFNDARFTDDDWKGIGTILDSVKEDDPLKVGRFGLGFKSVFHMTDLPCVLSGDRLELIDPHNTYFNHEILDLDLQYPSTRVKYNGQIGPFEVFGSRGLNKGYYDGTLFRFPLRSEEMKSELTDVVYNRDKVRILFESFEHDAHLNLLFLRNLEQIEVHQRLSGEHYSSLLFKVEIGQECLAEVREQRITFKTHLQQLVSNPAAMLAPLTVVYRVDILITDSDGIRTSSWIVSQHFDGTEINAQYRAMKCLPLVGAALPIDVDINGNIFCFLPLPVQDTSPTGLPFHIHGYFALDHNRKHVKLPGGSEIPDVNEQWNMYLIEKALPKAMSQATLKLAQYCETGEVALSSLMQVIPNPTHVSQSWSKGFRLLIKLIKKHPILYTRAYGGRWVNVDNAVFENSSVHLEDRLAIREVLIAANVPLVIVPQHVKAAFHQCGTRVVTPELVASSYRGVQSRINIREDHKYSVLKFLLESHTQVDLDGLELLPLLDGTFQTFTRKCVQKVYIPSVEHPASLLPGVGNRLVDTSKISPQNTNILTSILLNNGQAENLSRSIVENLLPAVFPATWSTQNIVKWNRSDNPLTRAWLKEIWIYLAKQFGKDLSWGEDLHLLPLTNELVRLREARRVVLVPSLEDVVVVEALRNLSMIVIDDIPGFVSSHPQILNGSFILTYSATGILTALDNPYSRKSLDLAVEKFGKLASSDQKDTIRNLLCEGSNCIPGHLKHLIQSLPIFTTCQGIGFNCEEYASLKQIAEVAPNVQLPVRCPLRMIDPTKDKTSTLISILDGPSQVSVIGMLVQIFDNLQQFTFDERLSLAMYLLQNHNILKPRDQEEQRMLCAHLKRSPLFLNREGRFAAVKDMFVVDDEVVNVLIEDADKFPWNLHGEAGIAALKNIGLKTSCHISAQEILMVAQSLDKQWQNPVPAEVKKSTTLLHLLQDFPKKLEDLVRGIPLKEHLKKLRWFWEWQRPTDQYPDSLPWHGSQAQFQKPEDCYTWSSRCLVGSTAPVADVTKEMARLLGLKEKLQYRHLINHLKNVTDLYCSSEKDKYLYTVKLIYQFLSHCNSDTILLHLERLGVSQWIWHGDGFAGVEDMACQPRIFAGSHQIISEAGLDLRPYIYTLPEEIQQYGQLFRSCGMNEHCDVLDVLERIRDEHTSGGSSSTASRDLKIALAILEELKPEKGQTLDDDVKSRLLIPIQCSEQDKLQFALRQECTGRGNYRSDATKGLKICHHGIPMLTVDLLGIPSPLGRYLTDNSEAIGMTFGQHEKLTNRLQRILTGYPRDSTILKELLQNADDAGATEIHIVLDSRQHSAENVFGDQWKQLQGPALLVYNNRPFTEKDILGIQSLGEGTKGNDPTKTGQYGIGFNCVYHLTDVPMFLTGDNLCVMDPQCKYVPGADSQAPGRRFSDLVDLRNDFPDVFKCFMENNFSLEEATLFRFPLRMRDDSVIGRCITMQEVKELMNVFISDLPESLLFLSHVEKVALSYVDEVSGSLKQMYQVHTTLSEKSSMKRKLFSERLKMFGRELINGSRTISEIPCETVLYNMSFSDSNKIFSEYRIGQQIGYQTVQDVPDSIVHGYQVKKLALLPRGGVAFHCSESQTMDKSKLFCFLPLPLQLNFPDGVYINGHFALESESRRSLCPRDSPGMRADWNEQMMKRVVGPLYATMIDDNRGVTDQLGLKGLNRYKLLFPAAKCRGQLHLYCDVLHDAIYQTIYGKALKVLPVSRPNSSTIEWYSPNPSNGIYPDVFFDDLNHCKALQAKEVRVFLSGVIPSGGKPHGPPPHKIVQTVLLESNLHLLHLPLSVHKSFKTANADVKKIQPLDVIRFFSTHPLKRSLPMALEVTPFKILQQLKEVITYCKEETQFFKHLPSLPFLLTSDMQLRVANTPGVYLTRYHGLFSNQKHKFVHPDMIQLLTSDKEAAQNTFEELTVKDLVKLMKADPNLRHLGQGADLPFEPENNRPWLDLYNFWVFLRKEADKVVEGNLYDVLDEKDRERIDLLLAPLAEWSVFPVTQSGRNVLFPLSRAATAVDLSECGQTTYGLQKALCKVNFPRPNYNGLFKSSHFTTVGWERSPMHLAKILVASVTNPAAILHSFRYLLANCPAGDLSRDDAKYLLLYFSDHCESIKKVPNAITTLRHLPYYNTVNSELISLGNATVYVIPANIPTEDMDSWKSSSSGLIFLKKSDLLAPLHQFIGCTILSEVEIYTVFILEQEHFNRMSEKGRKIHLEYILQVLLPKLRKQVEEGALLDKLAKLRFIPGADGQFYTAGELFDPTHKVFEVMYEPSHFPPSKFSTYHWLPVLRKLGLQCEVTKEMFLEFAITVAGDAITPKQKTEVQSQVLVEFLLEELEHEFLLEELEHDKPSQWQSEKFLKKVKSISFIAPKKAPMSLQHLHSQYGLTSTSALNEEREGQSKVLAYAKYDGSFIGTKDTTKLLWTSSVLIPSWARFMGEKRCEIMQSLGVAEKPTIDAVLRHLIKLCKYRENQPVRFERRNEPRPNFKLLDVLKNIYRFLSQCDFPSQCDFDTIQEKLQDVKCIAVEEGSRLVSLAQVVIDINEDDEIKPYLYKIPYELGEFSNLFLKIGMLKKPSALHYVSVLDAIHKETQDEEMIPPELHKAVKAYVCLIDSAAVGPLKKNPLCDLGQLYLPSRKRKLRPSGELVFNDDWFLNNRLVKLELPFIIDDQSCTGEAVEFKEKLVKLKMKHFFNVLPQDLRPVYLPDVVTEEMEEPDAIENQITSDMADKIRLKLGDRRFTDCLLRLMRHDGAESYDVDSSEQEEQIGREIVNGLANIDIMSIDSSVTTHISYNGVRVEGSEQQKEVHARVKTDQEGNTRWTVFVASTFQELDSFSPLWTTLSDLVNTLTGSKLTRSMEYLNAILRMDTAQMSTYLDGVSVQRLTQTEPAQFYPTIGEPIPLEDHHLLQPDFLEFADMEDVGVEIYHPILDSAEVENEYEESDTALIIHGKVICEAEDHEDNPLMKKYQVMVSYDRIETIDTLRLYKWCRMKTVLMADGGEEDFNESDPDKVKTYVTSVLESAYFSLDDERRIRVVVRLLRKWQPMNNVGNEAFCQEIVEHIGRECRRLDQIDRTYDSADDTDMERNNIRDTPRAVHRQISRGTEYLEYYTMRQAQVHREDRDQYKENYHKSELLQRSWSVVPPTFCTNNPQPGEARRWLKQAKYDLEATENDMVNKYRAYEWVCFKSHQSAEKALKAVHYSKDYRSHDSTHHLAKLASYLDDEKLQTFASKLHNLIGDSTRMRYPDNLTPPWVPHEVFKLEKAHNARELAAQIVTRAEELVLWH